MEVLSQNRSVYDTITQKIADAIRDGAGPFKMPWHTDGSWMSLPINVFTEAYYRGVNILTLWLDAKDKGYPSSRWASYRQWQKLGAQVRKGERGSLITFYQKNEPEEDDAEDTRPPFVLRVSHVFNAAQVDGWEQSVGDPPPAVELDRQVAAFVEAIGARVNHGYRVARYRLDLDTVEMPSPAWFFDTGTRTASQAYHAILLHELIHWSGAGHRIGREFGKTFGDKSYAFEELIAELGSAFLCSTFGIANEPRSDHAAYVGSWLKVLDRDRRAIFTAASKAQEAINYLSALAFENGFKS
jgi:antirestriction protein ArdC